ncbi:hypothetical protein [Spirillospora sp. CA-294931]|uniref:hypothetical protein n=1 Tax=Spirillospora sp. CA-294931 TaxID=3240042 RepID=UPI003D8B09F6
MAVPTVLKISRAAAVLIVGVGALAACGSDDGGRISADSPAPRTSAPNDASDGAPAGDARLVLRSKQSGGFAGLGGPGSVPDFSLFSDGRAIVSEPKGAVPVLREYRLTPAALAKLLADARAAGLERSRSIGEGDQIADGITLEISMGRATTRILQPESRPDPAARFAKRLDPSGWAPGDLAAKPRVYEPAAVAAIAGESLNGTGRTLDWTLAPLGKGEQAAGGLCTVLKGRDAQTARKVVGAEQIGTGWRSQGKVYSVRLRPLLPDESTCKDAARA